MNSYICIDMRNDILHANIITTCLMRYLFPIKVLRWFLAISLFWPPWQLTSRESLHAVWYGTSQLHNNHPTEAEESGHRPTLWVDSQYVVVPLKATALASESLHLNDSIQLIFNKHQCGFQKGKSNTDQNILVQLESYIRQGFVYIDCRLTFNRRAWNEWSSIFTLKLSIGEAPNTNEHNLKSWLAIRSDTSRYSSRWSMHNSAVIQFGSDLWLAYPLVGLSCHHPSPC